MKRSTFFYPLSALCLPVLGPIIPPLLQEARPLATPRRILPLAVSCLLLRVASHPISVYNLGRPDPGSALTQWPPRRPLWRLGLPAIYSSPSTWMGPLFTCALGYLHPFVGGIAPLFEFPLPPRRRFTLPLLLPLRSAGRAGRWPTMWCTRRPSPTPSRRCCEPAGNLFCRIARLQGARTAALA